MFYNINVWPYELNYSWSMILEYNDILLNYCYSLMQLSMSTESKEHTIALRDIFLTQRRYSIRSQNKLSMYPIPGTMPIIPTNIFEIPKTNLLKNMN